VSAISFAQLTKLQTLWHQYAARDLTVGDPRAVRLHWASQVIGRKITSFKDCTKTEANRLIFALNGVLGLSTKSEGYSSTSRSRAHQRGTQGRRNSDSKVLTLATTKDIARIDQAMDRLGWSRVQFDAWLRSPTSPLKNRGNPQIKTQADANRVWWAMKRLLQRAGRWNNKPTQEASS
jgi:hypothetical protein